MEVFPEVGPGLEQSATKIEVGMVAGFFVLDVVGVGSGTGNLARGKIALEKRLGESEDD